MNTYNEDTVMSEIEMSYFDWLYDKVCSHKYGIKKEYYNLFHLLYSTEFTWTIEMDSNRAADGATLRYIYATDIYGDIMVKEILSSKPINVLEVLIALSDRLDREYSGDPVTGSKAYKWFWLMIKNMDLYIFYDGHFNPSVVKHHINRMLNREYSYDGKGGLFYSKNPDKDFRDLEIWSQAMRCMDSI